jgi:hypothetical protein
MSRFREFPYRGSLLRRQSGEVQEVFHEPISAKVLVERMELVRHIVDEAVRLVPGRITFHWSHACQVRDGASAGHLTMADALIRLPSLTSALSPLTAGCQRQGAAGIFLGC